MRKKEELEKKVNSYIKGQQMLSPKDRVVVGVSGGADSVCLLFMLLQLKVTMQLELIVAHINHGVREDAGEDAEYVRSICKEQGIPFELLEVNLKEIAKEYKLSQEEAGRKVRYETFQKILLKYKANKIAVAHNSNDRAETMLFHLFRGSGLAGLSSILPVRDHIIRPLLCLKREEIEEYLKVQNIEFRTDSTNLEDDYTRNRIRHHILPFAEDNIAQGSVSHMCNLADIVTETEDYLQEQTRHAMEQCCVFDIEDSISIQIDSFDKLHLTLKKRLLRMLLQNSAQNQKDIGMVHIMDFLSLFQSMENREIHFPYNLVGKRRYDKVILEKNKKREEANYLIPLPFCISKEELDQEDRKNSFTIYLSTIRKLQIQVLIYEKEKDIPQNRYTKWFDYDKIYKSLQTLQIRTRMEGDFLMVNNKDSDKLVTKKLNRYMMDEKIPKDKRDQLLLFTDGNHVIWVIGYRISEYYKINENTKRILQVCDRKQENN